MLLYMLEYSFSYKEFKFSDSNITLNLTLIPTHNLILTLTGIWLSELSQNRIWRSGKLYTLRTTPAVKLLYA
jgi:hypothetical protein